MSLEGIQRGQLKNELLNGWIAVTNLKIEAGKMEELLIGKSVKTIKRHRIDELMIEEGSRLFVNATPDGLKFSITEAME